MSIAVVVPTIRYQSLYPDFLQAWDELFHRHEVRLLTVEDGDEPLLHLRHYPNAQEKAAMTRAEVMGESAHLVMDHSPACSNLGFAYIGKYLNDVDTIIRLDDDLEPIGDPIEDHLKALNQSVPISWLSSTSAGSPYMRGMPYGIRREARVWVSHGVWHGVPDLDASTQLQLGETPAVSFYRGPVPRGIYFPFSSMNIAFKRAALPYLYLAPVALLKGAERFDDIWLGIQLTRMLDLQDKAMVTGYSVVQHARASNVFKNLQREAYGLELNEDYWRQVPTLYKHDWFYQYDEMRSAWQSWIFANAFMT